jgi:diguanylate cyclase (GGDEF)-like protein
MKKIDKNILIILLTVFSISVFIYWFEYNNSSYAQILRYLYLIPIIFSSLIFDLAAGIYLLIFINSLYIPLFFFYVAENGFDEVAIELFVTLFLFLIIGIFISVFVDRERRKKESYKHMSEIGNVIASSFNIDTLIDKTIRTLINIFECESGFVAFFEENNLFLVDGNGKRAKMISNKEGIIVELMNMDEPIYSNNIELDCRFSKIRSNNLSSFISCPIMVKNKKLGVVILENKKEEKRFVHENSVLLKNLVFQIGLSIYNLKLYELAIIDGLTQTYTHRFFQKKIRELIGKGVLTFVLADIDFFKKINDTYGHPQGDYVLKTIAKTLKEKFGNRGFVCRYGGEEFGIIIPNLFSNQANSLVEEVRIFIENYSFDLNGQKVNITLSFGIADSRNGLNAQKIIEKADQALYRAKEEGRNRVCLG